MAKKSYYQQREDELKMLISEVKIKNKLTDEQLAKLIPIPLSTFRKRKTHPGRLLADQVWRLEQLVGKEDTSSRRIGKGGERGMDLGNAKTCELVAELEKRQGVEKITAEPYQNESIFVEGPAIILVLTD